MRSGGQQTQEGVRQQRQCGACRRQAGRRQALPAARLRAGRRQRQPPASAAWLTVGAGGVLDGAVHSGQGPLAGLHRGANNVDAGDGAPGAVGAAVEGALEGEALGAVGGAPLQRGGGQGRGASAGRSGEGRGAGTGESVGPVHAP